MGSIVVVVVLPLLEAVVEEVDVVDDLAFEQPVELFGVDPAGGSTLPSRSGGAGLMRMWSMPLSSRCQWKD